MIITVAGGKGGTGKSMIATSLAFVFAKTKKTFLVDVDVECPNDHLLLNIDKKQTEIIYQIIPKWNFDICIKCGKCAEVCKQQAIAFVKGKYPVFVKDVCIGCKACFVACPVNAISDDKKEIGTVYRGSNYDIELITGELKIGELASGEVVSYVRQYAEILAKKISPEIIIIDAAAGIGCPVIASIVGSDYLVAVTEPTPSALHDLKRMLYLGSHFQIPQGIVINKYDIEKRFCKKIENFAQEKNIPIIGYIPYHKNFIDANLNMKPVLDDFPEYLPLVEKIIFGILKMIKEN